MHVSSWSPPVTPLLDKISERERTILPYLAEGWSKKEIASELHISVKTIEKQKMRRLGVSMEQLQNEIELLRGCPPRAGVLTLRVREFSRVFKSV